MSIFVFSTKVDDFDQVSGVLPVDPIDTPPFLPSSPIIPFSSPSGSAVIPDVNTLTDLLRAAILADALPAPLGSVSAPGRPASPVAPAWSPITSPSDITIEDVPSWRSLEDGKGAGEEEEEKEGGEMKGEKENDGRKRKVKMVGGRRIQNHGPKFGVFTEKKKKNDGEWPARKRPALVPLNANKINKRQK